MGMLKSSRLAVLLASSVGVPYAVSNGKDLRNQAYESFSNWTQSFGSPWTENASPENGSTDGNDASGGPARRTADGSVNAPAMLAPLELQPISRVFRLDVTTAWVLGTWTRVSTSLAELDLHGYRVALVTGTRDGDVAGSLTYYFNRQQRVQRIVFQGSTGDARPLVHHLATEHHFVRQTTSEPGLFLYQVIEGRKIMSELRVKPVSIVRQDDHFGRFEVTLVMERPASME